MNRKSWAAWLIVLCLLPAVAGCGVRTADRDKQVDIDLTAVSDTIALSELYNMLTEPDQYLGKTVKMNGYFTYYHDEDNGSYYFACIKEDATGCCGQGMEFRLTEGSKFPDDYPEDRGDMIVVGTLDTYTENDFRYAMLRDARLIAGH